MKYTIELWRDGELERVFDCKPIRREGRTGFVVIHNDRIELVTGDELQFNCDDMIELLK